MTNLKDLIKTGTLVLGIGLTGILTTSCSDYLKPEDFENAPWKKYNNTNGRIWTPYMNEEIPHNSDTWALYLYEVRKRNPNGLGGWIELPDLDKDGKVGKY